METTKYVIVREDGFFYWKNKSTSSSYGYEKEFAKAYLFDTEAGAKKRLFTARPMTAEVRKVRVLLDGNGVNG